MLQHEALHARWQMDRPGLGNAQANRLWRIRAQGLARAQNTEPLLLGTAGQEWFNYWGNDTAALSVEGLYGTENEDHLAGKRVDLDLYHYGMPGLGVLLIYHKHGGGYQDEYTSVGDMSRLNEWVENLHRTKLPVGLFIPFARAYDAVKEFIETDGELPKCIEWVANKDLPPCTFPDPAVELEERFREK